MRPEIALICLIAVEKLLPYYLKRIYDLLYRKAFSNHFSIRLPVEQILKLYIWIFKKRRYR